MVATHRRREIPKHRPRHLTADDGHVVGDSHAFIRGIRAICGQVVSGWSGSAKGIGLIRTVNSAPEIFAGAGIFPEGFPEAKNGVAAKHADDAKGMQVAEEQPAIGGLGRAEEEFHEG